MKKIRLVYYLALVSFLTVAFGFSSGSMNETKSTEEKPAVKIETPYTTDNIFKSDNTNSLIQNNVDKNYDPKVNKRENEKMYRQVTSYYLNVRKEPNQNSSIIDVLVKDYVVEILYIESNGWLRLKDGGFVNGKYTRVVEGEEAAKLIFQQSQKPKPKPVFNDPVVTSKKIINYRQSEPNGPIQAGVTVPSNVSVQQLQKLLDGTDLEGIEYALKEVEDKFGINALFTLAVAKLESGHGTSALARNKNNLFGMNAVDGDAYGKGFAYPSKSHSVLDFGQRIKKYYVNKGLDDLHSINRKYSSSPTWASKVSAIMYSDIRKLKSNQ